MKIITDRKKKILKLKTECKRLASDGVKCRKQIEKLTGRERYDMWDEKREVGSEARIHYIAYCLLRGSDYAIMEPKIGDQGNSYAVKQRARQVAATLQIYCTEDEQQTWTQEHVESIFKAAAEVRSSGR